MLKNAVLAETAATYILMYYNAASWVFTAVRRFQYGILIIWIKADTRNFSQKYQQFFLLDTISFQQ